MLKESQQIKFKSSFNDEVIETLSAFANTKDGNATTAPFYTQKMLVNVVENTDNLGNNTEKGTEKITKNQELILNSIVQNPYTTIEDLVVIVGIAASKIKENLSKLKTKGLIERIGADKGGYWKIIRAMSRVVRLEQIENRMLYIHSQNVILDNNVAELYDVENYHHLETQKSLMRTNRRLCRIWKDNAK